MLAPVPFLYDKKFAIWRNLFLVIVLVFIAVGQIPVIISNWADLRTFVFVEIAALTLLYIGAVYLNIYLFIPRLLLHNKYVAYTGVLIGMAGVFLLAEIWIEWSILTIYQLPQRDYGFFAKNSILFFDILSNLVAYFISMIATSLIVFLRHWWQSGDRIRELEETGVRVELEKTRNKIDPETLFDVLQRAASIAVSLPHEASRMLMDLSKLLRRQLYESDHRQVFSTQTKQTNHLFGKQYRWLNFLIEKRYRLLRNLLLVFAVCIIISSNVSPHPFFPFIEFVVNVLVFLALGYFNVYVLLPHLLLKHKWIAYFVTVTLVITLLIVAILPASLVEGMSTGILVIYIISSIVKIEFVILGTAAIVLFQHWARNERYIARLETATMQAELEQLQNQINPHFLFNMLNNILVLIRENPEDAVVILHKMNDMLKYQFNDSTKKEVLLNDDIRFLTDFLNLEKIRRDRFEFTITADDDTKNITVPPLLFIPFVENAVKHSADAANLSYIRLHFSIKDDKLHFSCNNSKPLKPKRKAAYSGLGIFNIRRRLELLYHDNYSLEIEEGENNYSVQLEIIL